MESRVSSSRIKPYMFALLAALALGVLAGCGPPAPPGEGPSESSSPGATGSGNSEEPTESSQNPNYSVMSWEVAPHDGFDALVMNMDTRAETPEEMRIVADEVRSDHPEDEVLNLVFYYIPYESHAPSVGTGEAIVARDVEAAQAIYEASYIDEDISSFMQQDGGIDVNSYVEQQRFLCEDAMKAQYVSPDPEWGCFRWFSY